MFHDTSTMKWWIDIQNGKIANVIYQFELWISLSDYPKVTPVVIFVWVIHECPYKHLWYDTAREFYTSSTSLNQNIVTYDVSSATLSSTFTLNNIYFIPGGCFSSTAHYLVDSSGVQPSYVKMNLPTAVDYYNYSSILNTWWIDKSGVQEWSWLTNPETLYWKIVLSDGTTVDNV